MSERARKRATLVTSLKLCVLLFESGEPVIILEGKSKSLNVRW